MYKKTEVYQSYPMEPGAIAKCVILIAIYGFHAYYTIATVAMDADINHISFQSLVIRLYDDGRQLLEMGMIPIENFLKNLKV